MKTKRCSKCGGVKDVGEFRKRKYKLKDGTIRRYLRGWCKKCENEYCRKYQAENHEKKNEWQKKYATKHHEKNNERQKKYATKHPDKIKERNKKYRVENPEKLKEYQKKYVENLNEGYVVKLLKRESNLTRSEIRKHPKLIELKTLIIKTNRLCKTSKN